MDMYHEWLTGLRSWAAQNGSVCERWLFGSRAQGRARPDSDADLAVALMPPDGKHNWAFGNYIALADQEWKPTLEAIVGRHVSLEAIAPGSEGDAMVRRTGKRLWPFS